MGSSEGWAARLPSPGESGSSSPPRHTPSMAARGSHPYLFEQALRTQRLNPWQEQRPAGEGRLGVWEQHSVSLCEACGLHSSPSSAMTAGKWLRVPPWKTRELDSSEPPQSQMYSGSKRTSQASGAALRTQWLGDLF